MTAMRTVSRGARNAPDDNAAGGKTQGVKARGRFSSAGSRYEVSERAGEGTLFVVYKVRDKGDRSGGNRVAALRALKGSFAKNARFSGTLAAAAQSGLSFSHPHLAQGREVGEEDGTTFLVEEWLPGLSLEERLRRAPFGRAEALSFTRQIVDALGYLHSNGAVHGDLRPRQILSSADGNLKLTESGLWPAFPAAGFALTDVQPDAAYYLAPERDGGARDAAAPPSPQSDLYSLGVILYRMLTGRVPFDGPSPLSIGARHRRDEPMRPSQWNPACAPDLEELALRLLAKNPAQRPASAEELFRELGGGRAPRPVAPSPPIAPPPIAPIQEPAPIAPAIAPSAARSLPDMAPPAAPIAPAAVPPVAASVAAANVTAASASVAAAPIGAAPVAAASAGAVSSALDADDDLRPARRLPGPQARPLPPQVRPNTEDEEDDDPSDRVRDEKLARKKQRRREALGAFLAIFWLLVAVGLLAGITYGGYKFWRDDTPPDVKVAAYVGKSRSEAEAILARQGLRLSVVKYVYNPKRAVDTVLSGYPEPGRNVRRGREILVEVSKGEEPIRMRDYRELDLQIARQIIERDGARLGQISDQYHESAPKGSIIGQYPEVGESFSRSQPINLTVSRGPQPQARTDANNELPPLPEESPVSSDAPGVSPTAPPSDVMLVSRIVAVRVAIPADGQSQEVRIDVQDENGERSVYRKVHAPGDLVDESVRVTRQQGTRATVRVYINGALQREQVV